MDEGFTTFDGLADALYRRKNELGLSNILLDELTGLASGHCDKLIGPSRLRGISRTNLPLLLEALAVRLVLVPDLEACRRMEGRWERRQAGQVAPPENRVSQVVLARARPVILRELAERLLVEADR